YATGQLNFYTYSGNAAHTTADMVILGSGNVGIGATVPGAKLEIGGTSPEIYMNGATSNDIRFAAVGSAPPAFTTRSAGTKLVLNPTLSASMTDYALGVDSNAMWYSVPAGSAIITDGTGTGTNSPDRSSTASVSITTTRSQNLLILVVTTGANIQACSTPTSSGLTWAQLYAVNYATYIRQEVYYAIASNVLTSHTITITNCGSGSTMVALTVTAYNGVYTPSPFGAYGTSSGIDNASPSTSITTTYDNSQVVGALGVWDDVTGNVPTRTAGAGFTISADVAWKYPTTTNGVSSTQENLNTQKTPVGAQTVNMTLASCVSCFWLMSGIELRAGVGAHQFYGNTTERMRIQSDGLVGIGTSAPVNLLTVSGRASIGSSYTSIAAPANGLIVQGNMGVGDSTPDAQFEVESAVTTAGNFLVTNTGIVTSGNVASIVADALTTGTAMDFTVDGLSTGKVLNLASTSTVYSSGNMLAISKTGASGSTIFSGDIANITYQQTFNGVGATHTGNVLDVSRTIDNNISSGTTIVTGAAFALADSFTQTAVTLTNSSNTAYISRNCVTAGITCSGAILSVASAAGGASTDTYGMLIAETGSGTLTNGLVIGTVAVADNITTAINIGSTGVTTDISLQNGGTIDNNTGGVILLNATQVTAGAKLGAGNMTCTTYFCVGGLTGTTSGSYARVVAGTGGYDFYYYSSSAVYKLNVEDLQDDWYKILTINPRKWIDKTTGLPEIGFVGEEFDALGLNNLVVHNADGTVQSLKYEMIGMYAVEIMKDHENYIKALKNTFSVPGYERADAPMIVDNLGNFGLGVSAPTVKLDVGGSAKVTAAGTPLSLGLTGETNVNALRSVFDTKLNGEMLFQILETGDATLTGKIQVGSLQTIADAEIGGNLAVAGSLTVVGDLAVGDVVRLDKNGNLKNITSVAVTASVNADGTVTPGNIPSTSVGASVSVAQTSADPVAATRATLALSTLGQTSFDYLIYSEPFQVTYEGRVKSKSIELVESLTIGNDDLVSGTLLSGKIADAFAGYLVKFETASGRIAFAINSQGLLEADTLKTRALVIDNQDEPRATIGTGIIPAGATSAIVSVPEVRPGMKIFLTPKLPITQSLAVTDIQDGNFTVSLASSITSDLPFDWWLVDVTNASFAASVSGSNYAGNVEPIVPEPPADSGASDTGTTIPSTDTATAPTTAPATPEPTDPTPITPPADSTTTPIVNTTDTTPVSEPVVTVPTTDANIVSASTVMP
ncbi:MAG: hypothetical protein WC575_00980, partial [Patescibacteria group bacterium]